MKVGQFLSFVCLFPISFLSKRYSVSFETIVLFDRLKADTL